MSLKRPRYAEIAYRANPPTAEMERALPVKEGPLAHLVTSALPLVFGGLQQLIQLLYLFL